MVTYKFLLAFQEEEHYCRRSDLEVVSGSAAGFSYASLGPRFEPRAKRVNVQ
jgi:hypothetical protein